MVNFSALWKSLLFAVVVIFLVHMACSWYRVRVRVNRLQKMGLAMPPWNWLTGHLSFVGVYLTRYPPNMLMSYAIKDMYLERFTSTELFYLDLWPFESPTLVVCNAAASYEVNRRLNIKPAAYATTFDPQSGGPSLLSTNGGEWRYWRGLLNPGFQPGFLMARVGEVLDGVRVFTALLEARARERRVFRLEDLTIQLTVDTIMKLVLKDGIQYQREDHPVARAVQQIMTLTSVGSLGLAAFNPIRHIKILACKRVINHHLVTQMQARYQEYLTSPSAQHHPIIYFAIASYISRTYPGAAPPRALDARFCKEAIPQLRMLLIAGHDTTASILVYCYHQLAMHPEALRKLRAEHAHVLGHDAIAAAPRLLNSLPYTAAVIKEALRLFPPGGAIRQGSRALYLLARDGTPYPTEACSVSLAHHAIHYNPRYYAAPDVFLPDRWLDACAVPKGAFRPFEHGPRSCIGQDVALLLLKTALVLTARRFRFVPAYAAAAPSVHGEVAYQTDCTHPSLGYPCRVELVPQISSETSLLDANDRVVTPGGE